MGNTSNSPQVIQQNQSSSLFQNWIKTDQQYTYKNKFTKMLINQKYLQFSSKNIDYQCKLYSKRIQDHHQNIARIIYYRKNNNNYNNCNSNIYLTVYTEKLQRFQKNINKCVCLGIIKGFVHLSQNYGFFRIFQNMIWSNYQQKFLQLNKNLQDKQSINKSIRVWLNQNVQKNQSIVSTEKAMINDLVQILTKSKFKCPRFNLLISQIFLDDQSDLRNFKRRVFQGHQNKLPNKEQIKNQKKIDLKNNSDNTKNQSYINSFSSFNNKNVLIQKRSSKSTYLKSNYLFHLDSKTKKGSEIEKITMFKNWQTKRDEPITKSYEITKNAYNIRRKSYSLISNNLFNIQQVSRINNCHQKVIANIHHHRNFSDSNSKPLNKQITFNTERSLNENFEIYLSKNDNNKRNVNIYNNNNHLTNINRQKINFSHYNHNYFDDKQIFQKVKQKTHKKQQNIQQEKQAFKLNNQILLENFNNKEISFQNNKTKNQFIQQNIKQFIVQPISIIEKLNNFDKISNKKSQTSKVKLIQCKKIFEESVLLKTQNSEKQFKNQKTKQKQGQSNFEKVQQECQKFIEDPLNLSFDKSIQQQLSSNQSSSLNQQIQNQDPKQIIHGERQNFQQLVQNKPSNISSKESFVSKEYNFKKVQKQRSYNSNSRAQKNTQHFIQNQKAKVNQDIFKNIYQKLNFHDKRYKNYFQYQKYTKKQVEQSQKQKSIIISSIENKINKNNQSQQIRNNQQSSYSYQQLQYNDQYKIQLNDYNQTQDKNKQVLDKCLKISQKQDQNSLRRSDQPFLIKLSNQNIKDKYRSHGQQLKQTHQRRQRYNRQFLQFLSNGQHQRAQTSETDSKYQQYQQNKFQSSSDQPSSSNKNANSKTDSLQIDKFKQQIFKDDIFKFSQGQDYSIREKIQLKKKKFANLKAQANKLLLA